MRPEHEHQPELEGIVGRALAGLPAPRAPRSLLPRVLVAAARITPRPWYTRAWLTWPRAWQAASVAALAVIVAGAVLISPYADGAVDGVVAFAGPASARAATVLQGAEAAAAVVRVLWRALLLPIALISFAIAAVIALGGGACWNTINRLAAES
jgi:hypothetical protein